jgi:hypothetical protein
MIMSGGNMSLVVDKWISVREVDQEVDPNILLKNGDWLSITATGKIWAGVWFTGENGPRGWDGWTAGNDKPLPGSPPFCLLGRTAEDGYFYIGDGINRTYQNTTLGPGETRLFFSINDDHHGGGTGAFTVHIMVWRNPTALVAVTPAGSEGEITLFRGEDESGAGATGRWSR